MGNTQLTRYIVLAGQRHTISTHKTHARYIILTVITIITVAESAESLPDRTSMKCHLITSASPTIFAIKISPFEPRDNVYAPPYPIIQLN